MNERQEAQQHSAEEEVLDIQPGHVMARAHYERVAAEAATEAGAEQE
ncbi:MAG: hypothetical protein K2X55_23680 [Burkholderiaceae bacterium]|nr:hypothetical protein [Burkholderiaceae bacterium]MBY0242315.1 hypothetical protein [Burkholderiaceae bacterium]